MRLHRREKRFLRALRRPFEWTGVFLGYLVLSNLPRRAMLAVCDFAAGVMHFFDRRGRALALSNLRVVYGRDVPGAEKIVRRSYRSMARSVGYAFWTCRNAKARAAAAGEMSEEGKAFLAANRPAVTVSAHLGCWEILSQLAFLEGHRMMSVAKDIGTSGMTRLLMKARRSIGQEIVHADGAFRPLMQGLKDGKSLGLLVDLVDELVHRLREALPPLAADRGQQVVFAEEAADAAQSGLKRGRVAALLICSYSPEEARDIWGFTQRCMRDLERVIRRHPSCWVLNYRYFRKTPNAEELAQLEAREREYGK